MGVVAGAVVGCLRLLGDAVAALALTLRVEVFLFARRLVERGDAPRDEKVVIRYGRLFTSEFDLVDVDGVPLLLCAARFGGA